MNSFFKYEFKRQILSKSVFLAIIIILISFIAPYCQEARFFDYTDDAINIFIKISVNLGVSYFPIIAPLIVCVPAINSYISDKESGILNFIYCKLEVKKYLTVKIVINAIASGLILLISEIIILLTLIAIHGINNEVIQITGAFSQVYYSSKIFYIIIFMGCSFIFGVAYSTLALGISALTENKYLTVIIPFVYMIISGTIFIMVGITNLKVTALVDISMSQNITIIIYNLVIFVIGMILFYYFGVKNRYE